jgi:hypothetical protein
MGGSSTWITKPISISLAALIAIEALAVLLAIALLLVECSSHPSLLQDAALTAVSAEIFV